MWGGWLIALFACSDWGLGRVSDAGPGASRPKIVVRPELLDFGALADGLSSTAEFTVANEGGSLSVLEVRELRIEGDASFVLPEPSEPFRLPAGEERTLPVVFSPSTPAEHRGRVLVRSDDPERGEVPVALLGNGRQPELHIAPDPLDFGAVSVGCEVRAEVTLSDVGAFPLTVSEVRLAGEGLSLTTPLAEPLTIPVGSSQPLALSFAPAREGAYTGEIVVTSDEPAGVRTARVQGKGTTPALRTDLFALEADPAADLLFFVDQSWSMRDDALALASNFDTFIAQIDRATPNWRLLVINDDNGCNRSGVLDRTVFDYATVFRTAIASGGGTLTEAGLSVVARGLELTGPGECNRDFLREGAPLHVIFVTDEAEESPGPWEDYVTRMQVAVGDAWRLRISTVGGPVPDGCVTAANSATPALRYVDAVSATGGVFLSICSPWSESLDALADATVRRDVFGLSGPPAPGTVRVSVDGAPASAWRYDEGLNAVVFERAAAPREGQVVRVEWRERRVCPG